MKPELRPADPCATLTRLEQCDPQGGIQLQQAPGRRQACEAAADDSNVGRRRTRQRADTGPRAGRIASQAATPANDGSRRALWSKS